MLSGRQHTTSGSGRSVFREPSHPTAPSARLSNASRPMQDWSSSGAAVRRPLNVSVWYTPTRPAKGKWHETNHGQDMFVCSFEPGSSSAVRVPLFCSGQFDDREGQEECQAHRSGSVPDWVLTIRCIWTDRRQDAADWSVRPGCDMTSQRLNTVHVAGAGPDVVTCGGDVGAEDHVAGLPQGGQLRRMVQPVAAVHLHLPPLRVALRRQHLCDLQ
jgi:hypothetical protein